jgi:hypothetical protein
MSADRFQARDGHVYDTQAETFCTPTATLMAYANSWARFITALRDDDESVGNVLERAELS